MTFLGSRLSLASELLRGRGREHVICAVKSRSPGTAHQIRFAVDVRPASQAPGLYTIADWRLCSSSADWDEILASFTCAANETK